VLVNGKVVFSKSSTGRFPVDGEVEEIFAALKEGREPKPLEAKEPQGLIGRVLDKLKN
jgi:hypothetical protein